MEIPKATVESGADGKSHRLLLNGLEIGTVKSDTDARFHMYLINGALNTAEMIGYDRGFKDGFHNRD